MGSGWGSFSAYLTPWRARVLAGTQTGTAELYPHTYCIPTTWPAHSPHCPTVPLCCTLVPGPSNPILQYPECTPSHSSQPPACPLCHSGRSVSSGAHCCPQCTHHLHPSKMRLLPGHGHSLRDEAAKMGCPCGTLIRVMGPLGHRQGNLSPTGNRLKLLERHLLGSKVRLWGSHSLTSPFLRGLLPSSPLSWPPNQVGEPPLPQAKPRRD